MFPLNSLSSFELELLLQETKVLPHKQQDTWTTEWTLKFTQVTLH